MSSPQLLSNRYEIGDTLGYGGMSEVHRGKDVRLGRDVAVKVLRADLARDPTFQLRFRREAQNAAALNHPAIVAVYDTGETDSDNGPLPYIVMEYVDGRTLRDIVKGEGPLPARRAMEVMADASAALDFSHRHGIVHRDVKPANIMITNSGAVKVMDFGIARALAGDQSAVTQTAAVIGTAQYLSPEQARGETVDARSDVYAAGCVLFELLCGEPPFTGDSPVAVAYQHVREDPRKPSDLNPQVPASLDAVVLKALSKNPANRYQSAAEMRADLVRVLSGQRPKAPMVMSEEERTSMLASPSPATEVMSSGRHAHDPLLDEEDFAEEKRRKRRKGWAAALITAACVAAFALLAYLMSSMLSGPSGPTPQPLKSYVNMDTKAAFQELSSRGYNVQIRDQDSTPDQVNKVVNQTPPPSSLVKQGDSIILFNGTGPGQVAVPDLSGKLPAEAAAALQQVGLQLDPNQDTTVTDDPALFGRVVKSLPSVGTTVNKGRSIHVWIGKAIEKTTVLDVRGQPYTTASQLLQQAGFQVVRQQQDSPQPADTVIGENPAGGSQAPKGSTVTLIVSTGSQITMPDLRGKTEEEAQSALQAAGWNGQLLVQEVPTTDITQDGKVQSTNPAPSSTVGKTQSVVLYIASFGGKQPPSSSTKPSSIPPFNW